MNFKFDYIISNPPYAIGNIITKSVIDNIQFDNFINLMPISDYKKDGLYKHIAKISLIDSTLFEDANVQRNLCLSNLVKVQSKKSFDELLASTYDPNYRPFYILNLKCNTDNFEVGPIMTKLTKPKEEYSQETDFYITVRTSADGVHKLDGKASADKDWNLKLVPKDVMWNRVEWRINGQPIGITGMMIFFANSVSKDHFTTFWYKNPLMNDLVKGLNKSGGTCRDAIPNIDYSIDRDYEHLTLEDITQILREENPDVK